MIRRSRTAIAAPTRFLKRSQRALDDLRSFYQVDRRKRGQRRAPDEPLLLLGDSALVNALLKLFEGKCAYCESPLESGFDIDRFRPPRDAMDMSGRVDDPDLYWWLAYDWDNLYPSCPACSTAKGPRFPVRGRRARPEARGVDLLDEQRLLLDPCADEPEGELRFSVDGTVAGLTERGQVSIEAFALNRRQLVRARRSAAETMLEQLVALPTKEIEAVRNAVAPDSAPFAAMQRQLISQHLGQEPVKLRVRDRTKAQSGAVWVERVHLENFRSIRRLSLEFPEHEVGSDRDPWLLLLGVNGVGKSSVLQAIALPFMTPAERRRYIPDASAIVNRTSGEAEGHVQLDFSNGARTQLRFQKGRPDFSAEGKAPPLNVYAFGSTRLPPPPGARREERPRPVRLNNLFDPRFPLTEAEAWLANTRKVPSRTFTFLARALHELLELDDDDQVVRKGGKLAIRQGGFSQPMSDYSDGYRSIVAFATDLMLNLSDRWDSIGSAEGLVLVDELEVHLHPTWRMTVVQRLREVFPRLRFVVTTHDPLCLRGAQPGEVHVMRRDDDTREVSIVQRDIPPGLTADELLTGSWFGMATTLDTDTIALIREHGELLLRKRTPTAKRRRTVIEAELRQRRGAFAESDDERLVRSVVAELRAEKPILTEEQRAAAHDAVIQRAHEARAAGRAAP
jgi:uncharacterized protein (TIGR02646 family)